MKKGQSLGIVFPLLIVWIFIVVMIGMANQSQCPSEATIAKLQQTPRLTIPDTTTVYIPVVSELSSIWNGLSNFVAVVIQSFGYFLGLIALMFSPCSGSTWFISVGIVIPISLILLLKVISIIRGSE